MLAHEDELVPEMGARDAARARRVGRIGLGTVTLMDDEMHATSGRRV